MEFYSGHFAEKAVILWLFSGHSVEKATVLLLFSGHSVEKAAVLTLKEMTEITGGSGGCIVVTNKGEMAQHFTTKRMAWASVKNKQLHSGIDHGQQFSDYYTCT